MRYAETGYNLEIDLSRGSIDKVETDPKDTAAHLGGNGIGAKLLFDRIPPGTDPYSPNNLLIFGNGLLNGTPVPGANRVSVNTIAPLNGLMAHSLMGGFFGAEMKQAGYDRIIIKGKASDLVYIYINNDKVEIRDRFPGPLTNWNRLGAKRFPCALKVEALRREYSGSMARKETLEQSLARHAYSTESVRRLLSGEIPMEGPPVPPHGAAGRFRGSLLRVTKKLWKSF